MSVSICVHKMGCKSVIWMGRQGVSCASGVRARSWVFTDFELDNVSRYEGLEAPVLVVGKETCPTTGREHLQGYVSFANARSFSWWKNQFPGAHVEPRRGSEEEAIAYCRKEGNVVVDRHPPRANVRKRGGGDVQAECIARLSQGETIRSLWSDHPVFVATHMRMLRSVVRMLDLWGHRTDGDSSDNLSGLEL